MAIILHSQAECGSLLPEVAQYPLKSFFKLIETGHVDEQKPDLRPQLQILSRQHLLWEQGYERQRAGIEAIKAIILLIGAKF